ncbi:hypothetical protein F4810DRAFT_693457 [Camillea tinctor]|nr:hypothetical protein F4810DRAFT_693457 [Camillea tinctor]
MRSSAYFPVNETRVSVIVVVKADKLSFQCPWCTKSYDKAGNFENHLRKEHFRQLEASAHRMTLPQGSTYSTTPHVPDHPGAPRLPSSGYTSPTCPTSPRSNLYRISCNNPFTLNESQSTLDENQLWPQPQPQPPNSPVQSWSAPFSTQQLGLATSSSSSKPQSYNHEGTHPLVPQSDTTEYYGHVSSGEPFVGDGFANVNDILGSYSLQSEGNSYSSPV